MTWLSSQCHIFTPQLLQSAKFSFPDCYAVTSFKSGPLVRCQQSTCLLVWRFICRALHIQNIPIVICVTHPTRQLSQRFIITSNGVFFFQNLLLCDWYWYDIGNQWPVYVLRILCNNTLCTRSVKQCNNSKSVFWPKSWKIMGGKNVIYTDYN